MSHRCTYPGCKRAYIRREHLRRHERDHANAQPYSCHLCPSRFNRKETLKRHLNELHQEQPSNPNKSHQEQPRIFDKGPPPSLLTNVSQHVHQSRHIDNYFTRFHPKWAILHKATFQSCPQPPELVQAVAMVGRWTERLASPGSRIQAESDHDVLMRWVDIKLLPLLRSSSSTTNVSLNPLPDSLPILQTIFIIVAFCAFRLKTSSPFAMTNLWYLVETLQNLGAYEQLKIDKAVRSGEARKQELVREQYQRLALFSFKLHLLLWSLFLKTHPKFKLSDALTPAMLKVCVPCPPQIWDSPFFLSPEKDKPVTAQNLSGENGGILVSDLFNRAVNQGDFAVLSPLSSWDFELGICLYIFASKQPSQSNTELMKNITLVLNPNRPDV